MLPLCQLCLYESRMEKLKQKELMSARAVDKRFYKNLVKILLSQSRSTVIYSEKLFDPDCTVVCEQSVSRI